MDRLHPGLREFHSLSVINVKNIQRITLFSGYLGADDIETKRCKCICDFIDQPRFVQGMYLDQRGGLRSIVVTCNLGQVARIRRDGNSLAWCISGAPTFDQGRHIHFTGDRFTQRALDSRVTMQVYGMTC